MTESERRHFEVLLEEISVKVGLVLEGHDAIRKEFNERLDAMRRRQDLFESLLKSSHNSLKEEIQGVRTELTGKIDGVRTELKEEIQGVRTELKEEIQGVRTELKEEIQGVRTELKGVKEEMAAGFKALGEKIDGHDERLTALEQKAARL